MKTKEGINKLFILTVTRVFTSPALVSQNPHADRSNNLG